MNRLECQVTSCQHYCNNQCCLPGIKVDGPSACESSQTCCSSFEERHRSMGENVSACGRTPSVETSIDCKAEKCAYNENCKCTAECVCVGCFCGDVTTKSGTECCTFRNN